MCLCVCVYVCMCVSGCVCVFVYVCVCVSGCVCVCLQICSILYYAEVFFIFSVHVSDDHCLTIEINKLILTCDSPKKCVCEKYLKLLHLI